MMWYEYCASIFHLSNDDKNLFKIHRLKWIILKYKDSFKTKVKGWVPNIQFNQ